MIVEAATPIRSRWHNDVLRRVAGLALTSILLVACAAEPATGAGGRAALVVRHGDGSLQTACVSFDGDTITGEDLLKQSGLALGLDAANALGTLVCSIDGEGCDFPQQACLCQCDRPGSCAYWAYFGWDRQRGDWTYAVQGARMRQLHDGDLDAWIWLTSTGPEAVEAALPKDVDFEKVCPK